MSERIGISNVDSKATYNIGAGKKSAESSADFSSYLGETQTLDKIFDKAASKYNVSVDLLKAIGKAESNFDTKAVSRCGAQGVMQLMPATAKELGVTDSFDAEQNIMGGAKYISGLLKKYDGNATLACAAYNAGSGNVAKYGGVPPFEETQNYVKKIRNFMDQGVDTNGAFVSTSGTNSTNNRNESRVATAAAITPIQRNLSYVLTNNNSNTNEYSNLDTIFSYDDYMKFIDLLLNDDKDEKVNEKSEENTKDKSNYTSQDISYNVPVMNLLKDQNLI